MLLTLAARGDAQRASRWTGYIDEAAARFRISRDLIARVIEVESGGLLSIDGKPVISPAGAMGLMQLMPGTWRTARRQLALGSDPYDPHDNIMAGVFYLDQMRQRFGYPGMLAAYNAGPHRFQLYLTGTRQLPVETRAYVRAFGDRNPIAGVLTEPALSGVMPQLCTLRNALQPCSTGLFILFGAPGHPRASTLSGNGRLFVGSGG